MTNKLRTLTIGLALAVTTGGMGGALAATQQQGTRINFQASAQRSALNDLGSATVDVSVNGTSLDHATGAEVMGEGPILSVQWLANKLAEFGRTLEPGQRIMAGSFTKQYPIAAGDLVESRFTPFGAVSARFD